MQLLTILLTTALSFFTTQYRHSTMGMSYDIIPNKQTKCANDFGNGLSFFFEQVGGYGETAEVEQVSQVLKIDLNVFQDVDYNYDDQNDVANHWHDIDTISSLVDTFINKIVAQPNYYKQVHHNPVDRNKLVDEENELWKLTDTVERDKKIEALHQQPFYYYPNDRGYLSQGKLLKDLQTLKKTLGCYKKSGVTKIRFEYT
ncbi:MAG: hypothetical protein JSR71_13845 [Proteobacteria bacterium]|nr:hypothetical protein [Pseudomonadota bacterium]